MGKITLQQAAAWCGGSIDPKYKDVTFIGANNDTRKLEAGQLFKENQSTAWLCLNCGHVHTGESAPEICPVCRHEQGYFVRAQQSISA